MKSSTETGVARHYYPGFHFAQDGVDTADDEKTARELLRSAERWLNQQSRATVVGPTFTWFAPIASVLGAKCDLDVLITRPSLNEFESMPDPDELRKVTVHSVESGKRPSEAESMLECWDSFHFILFDNPRQIWVEMSYPSNTGNVHRAYYFPPSLAEKSSLWPILQDEYAYVRDNYSCSLPGKIVFDWFAWELRHESERNRRAQMSLKDFVVFLRESTEAAYAPDLVQQVFQKYRGNSTLAPLLNQTGLMAESTRQIERIVTTEESPQAAFRCLENHAESLSHSLLSVQMEISEFFGPDAVKELLRQWADKLRHQDEGEFPQSVETMIGIVEEILSRKVPVDPNEREEFAEEICLRSRVLFLGCLGTVAFHSGGRLNKSRAQYVEQIFRRAVDLMKLIAPKSRFTGNVQIREKFLRTLPVSDE